MAKQVDARPRAAINRLSWGALSLSLVFLLVEFFDELNFSVQGAVLPARRTDFGLTYAQVGLLLGLPHLLNVFIEPVIMLLGDTRLRRLLVLAGGVTIAAVLLVTAGASRFAVLLAAEIIAFPASGAFVSLGQATLMDMNPGREAQQMARWSVFGSTANLAGPLIAAAGFALGWGWRWSYLALAALALALVLLLARLRFPPPPAAGAGASRSGSAASGAALHAAAAHLGAIAANLRQALASRALLRWLLLMEASDLLLDIFYGYLPLYYQDILGAGAAQASLALGLLTAAGLAADLLLVPLLEKIPGRKVVRWTALLALVVYPAWLLAPWPAARIALLPAIRLATLGWYPVMAGEAYAAVPGRSGTVAAVGSLGGLIGGCISLGLGWVAQQLGLQAAMWLLLAGPLVLAVFVPPPGE